MLLVQFQYSLANKQTFYVSASDEDLNPYSMGFNNAVSAVSPNGCPAQPKKFCNLFNGKELFLLVF